ncbi:2-dehydropantoate 2-reductase [mine drainage metagenome]|uniref:2-dehydropantoate 2-reductase n=1 Tax=mine drainage metagenome TaxID=410659 RepID=A0A1J5RXF8_9ZZZZ
MRLLILGAGGIGGYYGGRLAEAGADVTFLVRPARAEKLAAQGLVLTSHYGDVRMPILLITQADRPFDAVLLSCKAYDLPSAIAAIAPAVGPHTMVLPLLNGLRHLQTLDERFGAEKVLGGLCHIGVTLGPEGEVRHLDHLHRLTLGPRQPAQREACRRLHADLGQGRYDLVYSDDILASMWEKYVRLASYAGMTCLMRAPIGAILRADDGAALIRALLAECLAVSTAEGYPPEADSLADTEAMLLRQGSPGKASMLRDIERGGPTEGEHILGDMLARARRFGLETPLLRVANAHLQAYEAERQA